MALRAWSLVADIGGTNARFGLVDPGSGDLVERFHYSVKEHAELNGALQHCLEDIVARGGWEKTPEKACFAVACVVEGERIQFTNSPWFIDRTSVTRLLGGAQLELINDFVAVGLAVGGLEPPEWVQVGGGAGTAGGKRRGIPPRPRGACPVRK